MAKLQAIARTFVKISLWIAAALALIFVAIVLLIQVPAIQTAIVHYANTFVSNKTHTKVRINSVNISFPKSVVIKGLFLEDFNRDTLLYAGKAKINIALYDLLHNKIAINSLALEEVNLHLKSTRKDSLFNYQFLLSAFTDTAKQLKPAAQSASKWRFELSGLSLKNARLQYADQYGGFEIKSTLSNLELKANLIDPANLIYDLDDLILDGSTTTILLEPSSNPNAKKSGVVLPKIIAKRIRINSSTVIYNDSTGKQSASAVISGFELENGSVDLQKEIVSIGKLALSKSQLIYKKRNSELSTGLKAKFTQQRPGSDWKVSVNTIQLDDNSVDYQISGNPQKLKGFNPDNQKYGHLTLEATGLSYSVDLTKIAVTKFSTTDQNNFSITGLKGDFRMDQHSITLNKLKLNTPNSHVDADFTIQFSSLHALTDSFQFRNMNIGMRMVRFQNSDILYFKPDLINQPFFKNSRNISSVSGNINGPMNNLNGKNLEIRTGGFSTLNTDFTITGLSKYQTASYHFPNLRITSGKRDLEMMAGQYMPDRITLPDKLNLQLSFKGKLKNFDTDIKLASSFGGATLLASIDPKENFNGKVSLTGFDVGKLLNDTIMYGPVSMTADAKGEGLDLKTVHANIKGDATQIHLNNYTYRNLKLEGTVIGKQFEGKINLNDANVVFDFDGLVNLNPHKEQYKFRLNVKGADLQKLNLTKNDIKTGFVATADFRGGSVNELNGKMGIANIIIAHQGKKYVLDSLLTASVNGPSGSDLNINSAIVGIKYSGTVSPMALPQVLNQFVNRYFPFSDSIQRATVDGTQSKFSFEVHFHNHPILSEVFFPSLTEFEPGIIRGSFDSRRNELKLTASIKKLVYGATEIRDLALEVNSDQSVLNYKLSGSNISNSQFNLDQFSFDGKAANNQIFANLSSIGEKQSKRLLISSGIIKEKGNFKLSLVPKAFWLMNNHWNIAADNFIEFGKQGFLIHHLFINHAENQINIASVHDRFNDDLNIVIKNFKLENIFRIVEKDSSLVKGNVDGNVLLKRVNNSYGLVADAKITNLIVHEIPIGNLVLKAQNSSAEKFNLDLNLTSPENNLSATGYFIPNGGDNSIGIKTSIRSLSLRTVEAFAMGQISEGAGTLSGDFSIEGRTDVPEITGELVFNNAFFKPALLNNRLELKHETIQLRNDGLHFNSFTLLDPQKHSAVIDGSVLMNQFTDFVFALQFNTKDFLLLNTSSKENGEFFGRMVIDSRIDLNGPMTNPVVNATVKMKKGSNFTIAVPEEQLTTDKGEDVVEFDNEHKINPILNRKGEAEIQKSGLRGFEVSSVIEIDKQATLRLLMDPSSTDSLVVKGDAALSFTIDRSGKMSLTGAYNLSEGSYLVSLESVIKRKFDIDQGSTIVWSGDPYDAEITLNAKYSVRASPFDLVADQMSGLSESDKNGYKQRYPFQVFLKLRGKILHPEISFEIQLMPEDKGILGGAVNQKLNLLNEDPSALNKQVFALLVLGRFIQENPLQSETSGTSGLVRATVGKFLSQQLNQWSSKVLPGVDLNFDIQSYNDYQTGAAKGRTQVEIGLKKQLFNERLSVQLGGTVDVEGERVQQNSASDITSDVTVEYKLTQDGRFRLKGFRHNQYEGVIEGQLIETGIGIQFIHDFNKWKEFFKAPKTSSDSLKKGKQK